MTDWTAVIVAVIISSVPQIIGYVLSQRTIKRLEKNTNHKMDELVAETSKGAYARGVKDQKERQET